jgi:6-phosphogluconolactonase/glucosamine-6-phosphate isomerase/deaminase
MADKKISELTAVTVLDGTEPLPLVQSGETKKATVSRVLTGQIVTEAGTSRTLAAGDNGKIIYCTSASDVTITCATGLGVGFNATIIQAGAGKVTLAAGTATLNSYSGLLSTMGQYAVVSVISAVADEFIAAGNLGV